MGIENPVHLLFIAAVALIVLGPKRLPALARALGQAVREFRASLEEGSEGEPETGAEHLQLPSAEHASGAEQVASGAPAASQATPAGAGDPPPVAPPGAGA